MADHAALAAWEAFYVIVGSSGGALIGLQFVVVTLIAERRSLASVGALAAFATPTVVHLTGALAVSAIMSAPWHWLAPLAAVLTICGLAGLAYTFVVLRREVRQTDYKPVWQDYLWFTALPGAAYAVLTAASFWVPGHAETAMFGIAAAALGLLLIGVHNAWDSIIHIVLTARPERPPKKEGH